MTAPTENHSRPRSPGRMIEDVLRELNWTQVQLAERLGAKKQNVNGWIRGREPLSEEKLRRIAEVTGKDPHAFAAEARLFAAWLDTDEGRAGAAEDHRLQLANSLTARGAHWLSQMEIRELIQAGLIQVTRGGGAELEFVDQSRRLFSCHLGASLLDDVNKPSRRESDIAIAPRGARRFDTEELFRLGPSCTLHFNGLNGSFNELGLHAVVNQLNEFENRLAPLTFSLINYSDAPVTVTVGQSALTASFYYDPFEAGPID